MAKVVVLEGCSFSEVEFAKYMNYISEERQKYILKFRQYMDQCRGLASALLARYMIQEYSEVHNSELHFGKEESGKPICLSVPNIKFNLSHSGAYVAGAFDQNEVGIDIEMMEDKDNEEIIKRFFCQEEYEDYLLSNEKQKAFYRLWTMKEAYVKYLGKGLSRGFDTFCIQEKNDRIHIYDYEDQKLRNVYVENKVNQGYSLAVVSETVITYESWNLDELLRNVAERCNYY